MKPLMVIVASRLTAAESRALREAGFAVPYQIVTSEQAADASAELTRWLTDLRRAS